MEQGKESERSESPLGLTFDYSTGTVLLVFSTSESNTRKYDEFPPAAQQKAATVLPDLARLRIFVQDPAVV